VKKEAVKKDALAGIAEKEEPPHIMALKEEVKDTEEVIQTEEKSKSQTQSNLVTESYGS